MKKNIAGSIIVCIITVVIIYYLAGGTSFSMDTPITYLGGDETSYAAEVKMMLDDNTWFKSDKIGAPYGTDRTAVVSYYLFNDVHILSFIFVKLTSSIGAAVNLTFFAVILLCSLISYWVMRSRKINSIISICGALSYAFLPYMLMRNISHLMLSAYQFIPLAILLCLWIYEDDRFWKFGRGFFSYRRNILGLLFAFLIANNGIGYYPVFSCFVLLIAGISKAIKQRKLIGLKQVVCEIGTIVLFMILVISRCIIVALGNGGVVSAGRSMGDVEKFSLKIARLFIPIYGTGIDFIDNIFNQYSSVAVFQYEITEFIGYMGILGFFVLLVIFFARFKENSKYNYLILLSELNICSVVFATIGGFTVFLYIFVTDMVRCTNRISLYISFCSILAFCGVMDACLQYLNNSKILSRIDNKIRNGIVYILIIAISVVGLKGQIRGFSFNNSVIEETYLSDRVFIEKIEDTVSEGAMIYQLPYNKYPDSGFVGNMYPDKLFTAYLHSENLRWSYGARNGEKSDRWNEYVSTLPMDEMFNALCYMGYEGIYIDSTAYEAEFFGQMIAEYSDVLGEPLISTNGVLYFYNLDEYQQTLRKSMSLEKWDLHVKEVQNW